MIDEARERFEENIGRVRSLQNVYERFLKAPGGGRRDARTSDVLRAAVVFLHAALEDFLRSLLRELLPKCGESALNAVPLVGSANTGRAEKFFLGRLSQFKNKSVMEVIEESIEAYLGTVSFNSTTDIVSNLRTVGVVYQDTDGLLPTLQQIIERRHNIVHQADKNEFSGPGHHRTKSISSRNIRKWVFTVEKFVSAVNPNAVAR